MSKSRVEQLIEAAKQEVQTEQSDKLVAMYKQKLRERASAAKVLANIDRELESLQIKIEQELSDVCDDVAAN